MCLTVSVSHNHDQCQSWKCPSGSKSFSINHEVSDGDILYDEERLVEVSSSLAEHHRKVVGERGGRQLDWISFSLQQESI